MAINMAYKISTPKAKEQKSYAVENWTKRKVGKQGIIFENVKTGKYLSLGKYYANSIYVNGSWIVFEDGYDNEKQFKTKSEALAFAKDYMKKN